MSDSASVTHNKWTICGLLLLASAINYMDRQALANASVRITREFGLSQEQYGWVESVFAYAFAAGSLVFGWLADRVSIRWLYAAALALWSAAGFATGFVTSYDGLIACRFLLGFFEAGHWPCAMRTTRALLDERERALGNSVLQSGTSIGAIAMPLLMKALLTAETGSWRMSFQVVGAGGLLWLVLWFAVLGKRDFRAPASPSADASRKSYWRAILSRRMVVVLFVVACINTTWQLLRAWLPKILQEGRGYSESATLNINAAWFAATDVGCIGAGLLAAWLAKRHLSVQGARLVVFLGCALLCLLCLGVPLLGKGWLLVANFLLIGIGALGVFPIYHTLSQDISAEHQGKVTGLAGVAAWVMPAQAQKWFGQLADRTGSFDTGLAYAGVLPMLAFLVLWLFWDKLPFRKNKPNPAAS